MLAEVYKVGSWKNLTEMEESLTLDEVYLLRNSIYEAEHRHHKFLAALKGVDLDEITSGASNSEFDEIKRKAEAALAGKSEEEYTFDFIGIEIEDDDE